MENFKDWRFGLIVRKDESAYTSANKLSIIYNKKNQTVYPLVKDIRKNKFEYNRLKKVILLIYYYYIHSILKPFGALNMH